MVVYDQNSGKISKFVEKPQVFVGNRINAGIYMFNPSILDRIEVITIITILLCTVVTVLFKIVLFFLIV